MAKKKNQKPPPDKRNAKNPSGSGTVDDPYIAWTMTPPISPRTQACVDIARAVAKAQDGITHVWIRHIDHETTRGEIDDCHITVYMAIGENPCDVILDGHIYVNKNENNIPFELMNPKDRKHAASGGEPNPTWHFPLPSWANQDANEEE